jgi:small subunit ribosomal protein S20
MRPRMAKTKSAKKAKRASDKRRVFNVRHKRAVKDSTKDITKLLGLKDSKGAVKALPEAYKAIDKAAKTGVLKKNTASRMKSRLARQIAVASK